MLDVIHHLTGFIVGAAGTYGAIALGLEVLLRLVPSEKPLSVLYFFEDSTTALAEMFGAIGSALDKILPNRVAK